MPDADAGDGLAPERAITLKKQSPPEDETLHRAWQALANEDPRQALALYRQLLAVRPDWAAARLGEATALARIGLHEEARGTLTALLDADPDNPPARANLLLLRAMSGEPIAEHEVRDVLETLPSADLYALLGHVHGQGARWDLAREAFATAHQLQPDRADHAFNLAVALERLGEPREALALYRRAAGSRLEYGRIDLALVSRRITVLTDEHGD